MECSIYDNNLKRLGLIRPFSLLWEEAYCAKGLLQLVVNKTSRSMELIQMNRFVGIPSSDTLMFISSIEDKDGLIWAFGYESKYLLNDRIYTGTLNCGNVEETLRAAVAASRLYPFMESGESRGLDKTLDAQQTYPDLFTLSEDWCGLAGYGFKLRHNKATDRLVYDIYAGTERLNVKFSALYGNMAEVIYKLSQVGFKNVAYVGGEGEGAARKWIMIGAVDKEGLDRREMAVDARDLSREEGMTEAQYIALLTTRGLEKLNEHNEAIGLTFDVNPNEYGVRYELGDTIKCMLPEYKLSFSIQIAGFQRTYEKNKEILTLILGTPVLSRR